MVDREISGGLTYNECTLRGFEGVFYRAITLQRAFGVHVNHSSENYSKNALKLTEALYEFSEKLIWLDGCSANGHSFAEQKLQSVHVILHNDFDRSNYGHRARKVCYTSSSSSSV